MKRFQLGLVVVLLGTVACVAEGTNEPNEPSEEGSSEPVRVEVSESGGRLAPQKLPEKLCACKDNGCGPTDSAECSTKR